MKIEIGESLVYSWLRHVKECQIVQNNWKTSSYWKTTKKETLDEIKNGVEIAFSGKYDIFRRSASIDQILSQGECDAIGCNWADKHLYGIDVAFHRNGTNYGSRTETVAKIISKSVRTAMCFHAYFDSDEGDILFVSPKMGDTLLKESVEAINHLQDAMDTLGYKYKFKIIANEDFETQILKPVIDTSKDVDDTAELFLRSYQLLDLFITKSPKKSTRKASTTATYTSASPYCEYKVGQLANVVLANMLESGKASKEEIENMLTDEYSKSIFHLNYPLLVKDGSSYDSPRYYVKTLTIYRNKYHLCSQWFETSSNNDRPYLEKWIKEHE